MGFVVNLVGSRPGQDSKDYLSQRPREARGGGEQRSRGLFGRRFQVKNLIGLIDCGA